MRHVTVPEPVVLVNPSTGAALVVDNDASPWTMWRYVRILVLSDGAMGKGYLADRARVAIDAAFKGASPGDVVSLEDAHYEALRKTIECPEGTPNPIISMQCLPLAAAIMEAKHG